MIWIVSDVHIFHENILKFCRPNYASVELMNDDIVKIWNSYIKPEDTVYNLGDLAFKTGLKKDEINIILNKLNGYQILIKGNHDEPKKIKNFPAIKEFHDFGIVNLSGIDFYLSHYPSKINMRPKDIAERPECFTIVPLDKNGKELPLLHGHTHDEFTIMPGGLCLCWDRWHRPVSENEIVEIYHDTNGFTENLDKYNEAIK